MWSGGRKRQGRAAASLRHGPADPAGSSVLAYWQDYYRTGAGPDQPSDFARLAAERLRNCAAVVDLGCGNGRDTLHFLAAGLKVWAIDGSSAAIESCQKQLAEAGHVPNQARFLCADAADSALWHELGRNSAGPLGIYARFLFHAVDEQTAGSVLDHVAGQLVARDGILLAEFRTPADARLQKAEMPHYRRYVDPDQFCAALEQRGLRVIERREGQGMARYCGEDAHVARIAAVPAVAYGRGQPSPALLRLQAAERALAERFVAYCEAEGLHAFLVAGSALGAVRHGDIIPWDDDVDLGMLREDYEQLLRIWRHRPLPGLTLQHRGSEPGYPLAYAKLRMDGTRVYERAFAGTGFHQGIALDIFPFDRLPRSPLLCGIQQVALMAVNGIVMSYSPAVTRHSGRPLVKGLRALLLALRPVLPIRALARLRDWLSNPPWIARRSERACFEMWGIRFARRTRVAEDWLVPTRQARFGRSTLPVPGQVERYLEAAFGDYWSLPPEDQRHPLHITAAEFGPASGD